MAQENTPVGAQLDSKPPSVSLLAILWLRSRNGFAFIYTRPANQFGQFMVGLHGHLHGHLASEYCG